MSYPQLNVIKLKLFQASVPTLYSLKTFSEDIEIEHWRDYS